MCKWWDRIIWKQEDRVSIFTTFLGTAKIQEGKVSQTHQSASLQATDGNFGQSFKDFPAALKVQCVHTHTLIHTHVLHTQIHMYIYISISISSVTQSCPTLCDPMNRSTPGLPVHHQLLEFTQTHVHWVGDVIQPSHPLLSSSPPAFNLSQHQGLFKWVSSSHLVAKVLEFQL